MNLIVQYLCKFQPLSQAVQEHLQLISQFDEWPQKRLLLRTGQRCDRIRFVEYGLLRCFHMEKGKQVTTAFMEERDFVISAKSFFNQLPAEENIEVLERAGLWSITYQQLQECYREFPEFNLVARIIMEKYFVSLEERLNAIRMRKAQDRLQYLYRMHPDLFARAPVKDIASYLGIAGETLSRLRSA